MKAITLFLRKLCILTILYISKISLLNATELPNQRLTETITVYDPFHQNLKAIPQNDIVIKMKYDNEGSAPDPDSLDLVLDLNPHVIFKVGSFVFADDTGISASGISVKNSDVFYSSSGSSGPWTYSPMGLYDPHVKAIRIKPTGIMNQGNSGQPIGFAVKYQAKIK